jgi:restriction system protein
MDPIAFEWLTRRLFVKLGYHEVTVTKQSGDGGIDVRATLAAAGVTKIPISLQVKRQKSPVGRPIVQNLRGSLGPHELGILITSGGFSQEAISDAEDGKKARITLIDGNRLIDLLVEYQIGVQQDSMLIFRLALDNLSAEKLQAATEEIGDET